MKAKQNFCLRSAPMVILVSSVFISAGSFAQVQFETHVQEVIPVTRVGKMVPGDVDGDGDQDLLIVGEEFSTRVLIAKLLLNNGNGIFSEAENIPFKGVTRPAIVFQDVDNDSDLDVMISGNVGTEATANLYINDGSGNFREKEGANFPGYMEPTLDFYDFDGNGTFDLVMTGRIGGDSYINLYYNDGNGNFEEGNTRGLPAALGAEIEYADVDGDNDMDFFVMGREYFNTIFSRLYLNENGEFTEASQAFHPLLYIGDMEFSDIDGDEDQDIIMSGYNGYSFYTEIYANDGGGNFQKAENDLPAAMAPNIDVGDFDLDGDEDIFFLGNYRTGIFLNNGHGKFSEAAFSFPTFPEGAVAVADLDGKGPMDIVMSGRFNSYLIRNVYFNSTVVNTPPTVDGLSITGDPFTEETLSVSYEFTDLDDDSDQSSVQWFRAENASGENKIAIVGATTNEYVLQLADEGKYLGVEITPFDGNLTGPNAQSSWVGPVQASVPEIEVLGNNSLILNGNSSPAVENFTHLGESAINDEIAKTFVVKNAGRKNLILSQETVLGEHASDFSIDGLVENLEITPTEEITFEIHFQPSGIGLKTAQISFTTNDEDENPFSFTVSGTGINLPPEILTAAEVEVQENSTGVILDLNATNGEGGENDIEITYSIGQELDGGIFTINPATGELSFRSSPNFEDPEDSDENNEYVVTVIADDGQQENNITSQVIKIQVLNVDEIPVASCVENRTVFLGQDGIAKVKPEEIDNGSYDDSEVIEISVEPASFSCNELGEREVTLIIKDSAGQTAQCTTTVTVKDNTSPKFIAAFIPIERDNEAGKCYSSKEIPVPEVEDNCNVKISGIRSDARPLADPYPIGETIIYWRAIDDQGNRAGEGVQEVVVRDVERPIIANVVDISVGTSAEECGTFLEILPPEVAENCELEFLQGIRDDGKNLEDLFSVGTTTITWKAKDIHGNEAVPVNQEVNVFNHAPSSISISGPVQPQEIGTPIPMQAIFEDDNIASVSWKAFNGTEVVQNYEGAASGAESKYIFEDLPAGVYTIILGLQDHCGELVQEEYKYVVVFDPDGGFVTGGGWILSPQGALAGTEVTGKAHFGFNAKYKPGNNILSEVGGNTSFQFRAGDLNFKSSSHENMSLVVSGGFKASYKGAGTINGIGGFNFLVTVIDAEQTEKKLKDHFRIRIWDKDGVVYDNNINDPEENADPMTEIGGGSIVIHNSKGSNKSVQESLSEKQEIVEDLEIFTVYPNPIEESSVIKFQLKNSTNASLVLYDLNGRKISELFNGKTESAKVYEVFINRGNLMKGIYFCRLSTSAGNKYNKQLIID